MPDWKARETTPNKKPCHLRLQPPPEMGKAEGESETWVHRQFMEECQAPPTNQSTAGTLTVPHSDVERESLQLHTQQETLNRWVKNLSDRELTHPEKKVLAKE